MADKTDRIRVISKNHKGEVLVIRERGGTAEPMVINPVKEGAPIDPESELFSVTPVEDTPNTYDVHTIYDGKKGPARIATKKFRDGWEGIFGNKPSKELN